MNEKAAVNEKATVTDARRSYHEQLSDIRLDVSRLGALCVGAIEVGTGAFLAADLAAAEQVVTNDAALDDLMRSIEERAYRLLALQQPMATDLRLLVSVLRTIAEIERSGDLMVNVAKAARRLYPTPLPDRIRELVARMGNQAQVLWRVALEAFTEQDAARASALVDMDDVMDELQKELFRAIFAGGAAGEDALHQAVHMSLVGRYYERIADHAVNVGQRVAYMVTGNLRPGDVANG